MEGPSHHTGEETSDDNMDTKPNILDDQIQPGISKVKPIPPHLDNVATAVSVPLTPPTTSSPSSMELKDQLRRPVSTPILGRPKSPAQLFQCDLCPMRFTQVANMRRHKISHFGVRPFECRFCPKRFFRKDHLMEHVVRQHSKQQPFRCPLCNNSFSTKIQLKAHLADEHSEHTKGRSCKVCGFKAATLRGAKTHFTTCHARANAGSSTQTISCDPASNMSPLNSLNGSSSSVDLNVISQNFILPSPCQIHTPPEVPYHGPPHSSMVPNTYPQFSSEHFNTIPQPIFSGTTSHPLLTETFPIHTNMSPLTSVSTTAGPFSIEYKSANNTETTEMVTVKAEPPEPGETSSTNCMNVSDTCLQQMMTSPTPEANDFKDRDEPLPLLRTRDQDQSTSMLDDEQQESRPPSVVTIFTEGSSPLANLEDNPNNCMASEAKDSCSSNFDAEARKGQSCSSLSLTHRSLPLTEQITNDMDSRDTRQAASSNSSDSTEIGGNAAGGGRGGGGGGSSSGGGGSSRDNPPLRKSDAAVGMGSSHQPDQSSSYNPPVFTSATTSRILTLHTVSSTDNADTKCVVTQSVDRTSRTCHFCNITFSDQTLYYLHRGLHTHSNPWKCNMCGQQCQDVYQFNSHIISDAHF